MFDISVVVLTYNPIWDKLKLTLNSILCQKSINFEIIIADDGSKVRLVDEIVELFNNAGFLNYKFTDHTINLGTVKNTYMGLKLAEGEYIKLISPGDMLYGENCLSKWVNYMKRNEMSISFSKAIYYGKQDDEYVPVECEAAPANSFLYKDKNSRKELFVDYMLANDTILGATIMARKDLYIEYFMQMIDKVIYAEDYSVRLMIFDGVEVGFVDDDLILYEYGIGISTNKNNKWIEILKKDLDSTNEIICSRTSVYDGMSKKYFNYLCKYDKTLLRKFFKVVMFPSMIRWRKSLSNNKTNIVDKKILNSIINELRGR